MGMHGRLALSVHSHFDLTKLSGKCLQCKESSENRLLEADFAENFHFGGGRGGDIMPVLSRGGARERATKAGMGKRGDLRRFGGGKIGQRGLGGIFTQNRMEGQKTGRGGLAGLLSADEIGAGTPLPSLLRQCGFVTNAPSITVAPLAPRVWREKKKYPFFSFFLMRGLVQGGEVCYKCTKRYGCTICTKGKG